jgi:hypothetical protein
MSSVIQKDFCNTICQKQTSTVATATFIHPPNLNPIDRSSPSQALVAQGRRTLGRNQLHHNRRNPPSIYAQPNAPTISEIQPMPNPKRIML